MLINNSNLADIICHDCAIKAGWKPQNDTHVCCMWIGECEACGKETSVTSVRDYRYIKIKKGENK